MQTSQPALTRSPNTSFISELPADNISAPPSWQVMPDAMKQPDLLLEELQRLAADMPESRFWILQQGHNNAESQRQNLANLDSEQALVAALHARFDQGTTSPATIQLLPGWQAAGILFTRHPLRQDLDHIVVEGITRKTGATQRLIYQTDGMLAFRQTEQPALDEVVGSDPLFDLFQALQSHYSEPRAAEWVYDGSTLWLLQTLSIGSLPSPREAWTCQAEDGFWPAAVTPLWYTLESRWLKTRFWEPLVKKQRWQHLHKVEPYRRQHSHIYRNSAFFREINGYREAVPPAWRSTNAAVKKPRSPGTIATLLYSYQLNRIQKRLEALVQTNRSHWQAFMELDLLGEELSRVTGSLHYLLQPLFLERPMLALPAAIRRWLKEGACETIRAGVDPIHASLKECPPENSNLPPLFEVKYQSALASLPITPANRWEQIAQQATDLRETLANAMRLLLEKLAADLLQQQLLAQPEDIYFCYFDELWQLVHKKAWPGSIGADTLAKRKLRYLEDAHKGAPDWKLDKLGFGFNRNYQSHGLLFGRTAQTGEACGQIRRVLSAWTLNQITPGDILVMHHGDPHWIPWISQAGGIVLASRNPHNPIVELARALHIPCIYGLDDAMHCLVDTQQVRLDAETGRVTVL